MSYLDQMNPAVRDYLLKKRQEQEQMRSEINEPSGLETLSNAFATISSGFSGKDPLAGARENQKMFDARRANQLEQVDKLEQRDLMDQSLAKEDLKFQRENETYEMDKSDRDREMDVNSEESKLAQDLASRMLPGKNFSTMSARDINSKLPYLQKMYDMKLKEREALSKTNPLQEFFQKEKIKEDIQVNKEDRKERAKLDEAEKSLTGSLKELKGAYKQFDDYSRSSITGTGPLATLGGTSKYFNQKTEGLDSAFRKIGLDEMVKMFAGMSKAVDSNAERRAFESTQPSITLDDTTNREIFERKIKAAERLLNKTREAKKRFDESGSFNSPQGNQGQSGYPRVVRKGNQSATVANEQEEQEAREEGFK